MTSNKVRVTSKCSQCGKEVCVYVSPRLAPALQGAKKAVCNVCDKKSSWRRTEEEE